MASPEFARKGPQFLRGRPPKLPNGNVQEQTASLGSVPAWVSMPSSVSPDGLSTKDDARPLPSPRELMAWRDLAPLQDVRGHLVVGHCFIDPGGAPRIIARNLLTRLAIQHARSLLRRKLDQNAVLHVPNGQIVGHQGTLVMPPLGQNVLSEKTRRVAHVEEGKNGGANIDLRGDVVNRRRCEMVRRIKDQGDMVILRWQIGPSARMRCVIGNENKQGILEPGPARCLRHQLADRPIRVLDCPLSSRARSDVDPTGRVSERPMVRGCHDVRKDLGVAGNARIDLAQKELEQVLVGHAPDGFVRDFGLAKRITVDDRIAVPSEEILHVVEVAVAAVEKERLIALLLEDTAEGLKTLVVLAREHGVTGRWGD